MLVYKQYLQHLGLNGTGALELQWSPCSVATGSVIHSDYFKYVNNI